MSEINHIHIGSALNIIRPNAKWVLRGTTVEDLEWNDETQSKPTQEEIDAQLSQMYSDNSDK